MTVLAQGPKIPLLIRSAPTQWDYTMHLAIRLAWAISALVVITLQCLLPRLIPVVWVLIFRTDAIDSAVNPRIYK
jgi:hypothetical protein